MNKISRTYCLAPVVITPCARLPSLKDIAHEYGNSAVIHSPWNASQRYLAKSNSPPFTDIRADASRLPNAVRSSGAVGDLIETSPRQA